MQTKRPAAWTAQRPEVALIGREQVQRAVAVSQHDDRRIGKPDVEIRVSFHDSLRTVDVIGRHCFQPVDARDYLLEKRCLRLPADSGSDQIVEFREDERRQDAWRRHRGERGDGPFMHVFVRIERRVQATGIQNDHREPKPSSAPSISSAIDGPEERNSGSLGAGASASSVSRRTASRIRTASLVFC